LISLRKFAKGSFWVTLATVITRFTGFATLPILARLLGPADLGLYNLVANTIQTADGLSRLGADAAMHRNGAQYQTVGSESVGRLFGVGSCITILAGIIASLLLYFNRSAVSVQWLGEAKIESWLSLAAAVTVLTVASNPPWYYLLALQEFKLSSIRSAGATIVGASVTLFLTWNFRLPGALWGLGATALLQAIWGWGVALPALRAKQIRLRIDRFWPEARSILGFGLPFYASNFLSSFIALPLLGYVSRTGGIEQLGYLRVAQALSQFISFLPTAIAPVLISTLAASITANAFEYRQTKSLHLRSLCLVILVFSTAICFSLEYLVPLLFGASYSQAILLSRLTIWITAISSFSGILSQYVISSGQTRVIAMIQVPSLFVNLALALWLIPNYSSMGLLAAQGFTALFTAVAYLRPALADIAVQYSPQLRWLFVLSFGLISATFTPAVFVKSSLITSTAMLLAFAMLLLLAKTFTNDEQLACVTASKQLLQKFL
jgi:O-antigen/teichoic acid export membrane protein